MFSSGGHLEWRAVIILKRDNIRTIQVKGGLNFNSLAKWFQRRRFSNQYQVCPIYIHSTKNHQNYKVQEITKNIIATIISMMLWPISICAKNAFICATTYLRQYYFCATYFFKPWVSFAPIK